MRATGYYLTGEGENKPWNMLADDVKMFLANGKNKAFSVYATEQGIEWLKQAEIEIADFIVSDNRVFNPEMFDFPAVYVLQGQELYGNYPKRINRSLEEAEQEAMAIHVRLDNPYVKLHTMGVVLALSFDPEPEMEEIINVLEQES